MLQTLSNGPVISVDVADNLKHLELRVTTYWVKGPISRGAADGLHPLVVIIMVIPEHPPRPRSLVTTLRMKILANLLRANNMSNLCRSSSHIPKCALLKFTLVSIGNHIPPITVPSMPSRLGYILQVGWYGFSNCVWLLISTYYTDKGFNEWYLQNSEPHPSQHRGCFRYRKMNRSDLVKMTISVLR
jgi:hypothetical protein